VSETFDADWLALRESVDHRSRPVELTKRLRDWLVAGAESRDAETAGGPGSSDDARAGDGPTPRPGPTIVDLGSGTGSNLRYLSPRLPPAQSWLLIDQDDTLLALVEAPSAPAEGGTGAAAAPGAHTHVLEVRTRIMDLRALGTSEVEGADVVSASALLDLVSSEWIESLADACTTSRCAALLALTFDGTIEWGGASDPDDDLILEAVNAHQRRQKGLGAALGPDAGPAATDAFRRRGYQTFTARSPWQLGRDDAALVRALVAGWVQAAVEQRPADESRIRAWTTRRERTIAEGDFALTVGHLDLLALP